MKKLFSILLALAMGFALPAPTVFCTDPAVFSAAATNNTIVVSSSVDRPDAHVVHPAVYKIEGANYFKLRDVAMLLNGSGKQFAVEYDDAEKSVSITSGKPYTAIGGELTGAAAETASARPTNNGIFIDGEAVTLTVFKINGANYFKLRDLGKALDFRVGYDDETKTVFISGARGYETAESIGPSQETTVLKEPPALTVLCGGNTGIEALKGTYSWRVRNGDGTETGINADSMHPLEAKKYMPYFESPDSSTAQLIWTTAPDKVSVRCWSDECWGKPDAGSEAVPAAAFETETSDGGYGRGFLFELKGGNCIYEIIAEWNGSGEYSGTARYSFYTVLKDRSGLRERFPQYFDLSTFEGLEVYVWSLAEGSYSCGILPGTNRNKTQEEIRELGMHGAGVDEMKEILASYDVPDDEIFLYACSQPISGYLYPIDEAYCEAVSAQFDNRYPCFRLMDYME